ncbi:MAG: sulfatase [Oligoflexales bacterium]
MKRIIFYLSILVVALPVLFYVFIIHPNDARISLQPIDISKNEQGTFESITPKYSNIQVSHSININSYLDILDRIAPNFKYHLQYKIPHKEDKFTIFTSPGLFPYKLDGRYGYLMPNNGSIEIKPEYKNAVRLELSAYAFGNNMELSVFRNEHLLKKRSLEKIENKINYPEWMGSLAKYLLADFAAENVWQTLRSNFNAEIKDRIKLVCRGSNNGYCVVTKPNFFRPIQEQNKKNVIMILVDTMRFDAISSEKMPFTKSLFDSSFTYAKAVAPGNMTSPSTNSILSCRKPHHIKDIAFAYGLDKEKKLSYYHNSFQSFPELFKNNGWKTAMIGNISIISEVIGEGIDHGFEQQVSIEKEGYETAQITREAQNWLNNNRQSPFFLYLHYHAPHGPYRAPLVDILKTFPGIDTFTSFPAILKWLYRAELSYTDRYLKSLFDTINALNLQDSTTILITSDHGDHHCEREFVKGHKNVSFTGAYFDHGATLYQDEIQVPLAIKSSDLPPGKEQSSYVSTLSIGPSLLELNGIQIPSWCDQRSLITKESNSTKKSNNTIGSEGFRGKSIIFNNRFKYIKHYKATNKKIHKSQSFSSINTSFLLQEELYDLVQDKNESINLYRSNLNLLRQARNSFREYYKNTDMFKLVIESPQDAQITVLLNEDQDFRADQDLVTKKISGYQQISYVGKRLILESSKFETNDLKIYIANEQIIPLMSTSNLPIKTSLEQLPYEVLDLQSQTPIRQKVAYFVRLDLLNTDKTISTKNKEFEKIMREWGYLNDG